MYTYIHPYPACATPNCHDLPLSQFRLSRALPRVGAGSTGAGPQSNQLFEKEKFRGNLQMCWATKTGSTHRFQLGFNSKCLISIIWNSKFHIDPRWGRMWVLSGSLDQPRNGGLAWDGPSHGMVRFRRKKPVTSHIRGWPSRTIHRQRNPWVKYGRSNESNHCNHCVLSGSEAGTEGDSAVLLPGSLPKWLRSGSGFLPLTGFHGKLRTGKNPKPWGVMGSIGFMALYQFYLNSIATSFSEPCPLDGWWPLPQRMWNLGIPCELSLFFGGMQQFNPVLTSYIPIFAEITSIFAGHRQIQIPFFGS